MSQYIAHDKHSFVLYSNENNWNTKLRDECIEKFDYWKELGAESVIYFLSGKTVSTKVDCYVPRFVSEEKFRTHLTDLELRKLLDKDKKLTSFHYGISDISLDLIKEAKQNYWSGDLIIEILEKKVSKGFSTMNSIDSVRQGLSSSRSKLEKLYSLSVDFPSLRDTIIPRTVLVAEGLQREYDEISGFSKLQQLSHKIVIKVDTSEEKRGKLSARLFSRLVGKFQDIIDNLDDGKFSADLAFYVSGLAPGSAILLADFESVGEEISPELSKELERRVYDSLSASNLLITENRTDAQAGAEKFASELKVDFGTASRIASSIQDLVPATGDSIRKVEISLPFSNFNVEFDDSQRKQMSSVKSYLKKNAIYKEDATRIIRGECGEVTEWLGKSTHKFKIKPKGDKQLTVYFDSNSDDDEKVKNALQTDIKIRVKYIKGKWFLKDWLGS